MADISTTAPENPREALAVALILRPQTIDTLRALAIQQKAGVSVLISAILEQYVLRVTEET